MTNQIAPPLFAREANLNDDDWRALEAGGGIVLGDDLRAQLVDIMEIFLANTDIKAKGVTQSKVDSALHKFQNSLETCRQSIWELLRVDPPHNAMAVKMILLASQKRGDLIGRRQLKDLAKYLNLIQYDIGTALKTPIASTEKDHSINAQFLLDVHTVFVSGGGDGDYTARAQQFRAVASRIVGLKSIQIESVFKTALLKDKKNN